MLCLTKGELPPWTLAPAKEAKSTSRNGWGKFCSIVQKSASLGDINVLVQASNVREYPT